MVAVTLVFAALIAHVVANPISKNFILHESRDEVPEGFTLKGAASPDTQITLRLGLANTDIQGLQDKLLTISTPANAEYGQWLTQDEVSRLDHPSRIVPDLHHSLKSILNPDDLG